MIQFANAEQSKYRFNKTLIDLYKVLPKNKIHWVRIGICDPMTVETALNNVTVRCDTLVLEVEIWAHKQIKQSEDILINHPKFKNCTKIVYTAGYDSTILGANTYKLSSNYWYKMALLANPDQHWYLKEPGLNPNVLCINGRDAAHRIELGYALYKANLLDSIIFSQGSLIVPLSTDFDSITDLQDYLDLLPIKLDQTGSWNDHSIAHPLYAKTYANVVTETEIELRPLSQKIDVPLITEKSFKPFFAGQIPIIFAGAGHYKHLKHLGFDMFEEILPAGFDYMSGRDKISTIVELISKGPKFFEDLYFGNIDRLKYNFDLATSNKPWEQSLQEVKELLLQ